MLKYVCVDASRREKMFLFWFLRLWMLPVDNYMIDGDANVAK